MADLVRLTAAQVLCQLIHSHIRDFRKVPQRAVGLDSHDERRPRGREVDDLGEFRRAFFAEIKHHQPAKVVG